MFRRARKAVSGDSLGPDGGGNIYFAGINITEKNFPFSRLWSEVDFPYQEVIPGAEERTAGELVAVFSRTK